MNPTSIRSEPALWLGQVLLLAALYVVTGWLGLEFASMHQNATLIWPPVGLSLAALIFCGRTLWPAVLVGSLLLGATMGTPHSLNIAFSVGNTLEATVGAWLLVNVFDFRPRLERVRDVALLVLVGGVMATAISTAFGVGALWASEEISGSEVIPVATIWWRGNFGGVVVIASFVMALRTGGPDWGSLLRQREFWLVLTALAISCALAFGRGGPPAPWQGAPLPGLPFACLVWAGIRLGTRGAALVMFVIVVVSVTATAAGHGPFVYTDERANMILIWGYAVGIALTRIMVSVAVAQRNFAEDRARADFAAALRIQGESLMFQERERILRDMHDGIGGQLVSVLSMVQRGHASAGEVAESLRRTLDEMRSMIDSLDPGDVSLHERLGRLRSHLGPVLRRNGLRLKWDVQDSAASSLEDLEPGQTLHVLRIIQAAVANVVQHAHASEVTVRVARHSGGIEIEIRDDGTGSKNEAGSSGHGIPNMQARADALSAELVLESANPGLRVRVRIPIAGAPG